MHFDREDRDACGVGFVCDLQKRASREPLDRALEALARLAHRGATGDGIGSADGAGVLTAIPWRLIDRQLPPTLRNCASPRAVGMCFFPAAAVDAARQAVADALEREGWVTPHWRHVPVDPACLGAAERATCPAIYQVIVRRPRMRSRRRLDASLHRARRRAEHALSTLGLADAAIISLSLDTIVYKALVSPSDLSWFYADLAEPGYETPFAVFHQRFSTNTLPSWPMAQPFHVLAHNGEINTILGNRLRADRRAREERAGASDQIELAPAVPMTGSDSRSLDAAVDQLRAAGFSLPHAFARLMPRAWEHDNRLSARELAFERYQAALADPWEGPAAIAFADGRYVGMTLDRNGFRPARVIASRDGMICAGSEIGIFDLPPTHVERMTRLGPGEMLVIDLDRARVLDDRTCRRTLAAARPYQAWVGLTIAELPEIKNIATSSAHIATSRDHIETSNIETSSDDIDTSRHRHITSPHRHIATSTDVRSLQRLFGYTSEELELILRPMATDAKEAVGSMGDDTPLAVLTSRRRVLSDYFRQRFAQVTNPPIDPLREGLVLSLRTMIGRRGRFLQEDAVDARVVELRSPVVTDIELQALCAIEDRPATVLPTVFDAASGPAGFEQALDRLAEAACEAVRSGAVVLVLSDRGADREHVPLPSLLATAAVYQALGRAGLGTRAGIVVDTGEARDSHQVAALLAFGAGAVCPWLALETARQLGSDSSYRRALEQGLLKIFSKMGVCTASAYSGSQLFEIVGLASPVVERFFTHTPHVAGSVDLATIAADTCTWHAQAVSAAGDLLVHPGFHGFRRNGDHHVFNPAMVRAFHTVAGSDAPEAYQRFRALVHTRPPTSVRDLLRFKPATPVALDEVEPVDAICRRFFASAMSVGALSPEAHRTLAIAMNRLGARSNSGEGGEEPERFVRTTTDWANSTTKQVASARFGVTPAYLASARELQIKMAQGSKPGEGGQLPGEKVVAHIARLRHAPPGTALISPPPHHDIYSIEDLAQLIYDLRSFHPAARINVKLVSTTGIGVIAAGVVKAGADAIQISGHSGGTGASPRGSIKHAGLPWEIGLLEAHRLLTERGTRHRVVLQTDGGLVTGHDVAMAAALGADEFGFGTAALVALGCVMARQCHLNTCPVGVATQRADLRAKYAGTPDDVVTYLRLVAADVRSILASLGLRSIQELVGRVDLLEPRDDIGDRTIDLATLLAPIVAGTPLDADTERHHGPAGALTLNGRLLARAGTLLGRQPITLTSPVRNTDRAVGATLAGHITRRFGAAGLGARLHLHLIGTAGQSLGAFGVPGLDITLVGAANDGVAKGLHGGTIVVRPPAGLPSDCVLVGNAALYGATGGRLFVAGRAGERFAVRNSGAAAVVEGVGQHGCEYMTGGVVVVLGPVGRNFAAGMTGGTAYVLDRSGTLDACINPELVSISRLSENDAATLRDLLSEHVKLTGSPRAGALLARWPAVLRAFRRVKPHESTKTADLPRSVVAVAHHRARAATAAEHSTA
jgi:glutamate synthase (ferredoxin)